MRSVLVIERYCSDYIHYVQAWSQFLMQLWCHSPANTWTQHIAESLESAITHNCKMSRQITEVLWIMHTVIRRDCIVYFIAKMYCQHESERNPP